MHRTWMAGAGGIGAAFLSALCCVGPLIFVTFGVGAGLAATFEPLRPLFGAIMVGAFGLGFYTVYGTRSARGAVANDACAPGDACASPGRGRQKAILWTALVIAILLWTFPSWSIHLI